MMNKAEKRVMEVKTLKNVYETMERLIESANFDIDYHKGNIEKNMEENPESNNSWYEDQIEEAKVSIEIYKKLQEMVYKMM